MQDPPMDVDRTVAGMILGVLGAILAAYTGWQLLQQAPGGLVGFLVGTVPGLLLALLLLVIGVWMVESGPPSPYARRLLGWAIVGGLFGATSAGIFIVYETSLGATLYDAPLVVANTAAGFVVLGLLVGWYDVRARQRATALERYKDLVENVPVGIFRVTPGPEGKFVEVNPAMVDIFGAEDERELLETPVREVYADPDEREEFSETLTDDDIVMEDETRYRRFDGETFWGSVTAIAREVDGETHFDGIIEDVTARKRYEQTLERHNEQLEVLNDVLRHDVRNDMAVISAHGERLHEAVDDEHRDAAETLLSKVDHVVELTKTARDLAEVVHADRTDVYAVPLSEILHDELDSARRTHDDATFVAEDVPNVFVEANDMLGSVFRNLLGNAVQHNDTDSPTVTVSVETSPDEVAVSVVDDGPGIPDNQKEDIFQHGEKGPESGGTGLGLYLVDVLVDQYDGSVAVSDNEPRGAVFTVRLRRAEGDETPTSWLG